MRVSNLRLAKSISNGDDVSSESHRRGMGVPDRDSELGALLTSAVVDEPGVADTDGTPSTATDATEHIDEVTEANAAVLVVMEMVSSSKPKLRSSST